MTPREENAKWAAVRESLAEFTLIDRRELGRLVARHLDVGTNYAIQRLRNEGVIQPVKRAGSRIYSVRVRSSSDPQTNPTPLNVIQKMFGPESPFCYGSALFLHGLSRYGSLSDHYVGVDISGKQRTVCRTRVHPVKTPLGLATGVSTIEQPGGSLTVTDIERTLLDCIHRPKYAQGWENIIHAIQRSGAIDHDRWTMYLKAYRLPSLVARTCAVFERFSDFLGVTEDQLLRLQPYLPEHPVRFSREEPGKLNRRWNIYVPAFIRDE